MRSIEEIQEEYDRNNEGRVIPECDINDMYYEELLSQNDIALRMWAEIMIDYCNCYDRMDFMYEMFEAMIEDNYKPTYNVFKSYMIHEDKPRYMPTDEDELNAVLDGRSAWKRSCEEMQNEMVKKFGVEWLSASGDERLRMMMEDLQKDNPFKDIPPSEDTDGGDYDNLPF